MTFDEVLAAARGLTTDERWGLIHALEAGLKSDRAGEVNSAPEAGWYIVPPNPRNGWTWEASPDLLAEMQRMLDAHEEAA